MSFSKVIKLHSFTTVNYWFELISLQYEKLHALCDRDDLVTKCIYSLVSVFCYCWLVMQLRVTTVFVILCWCFWVLLESPKFSTWEFPVFIQKHVFPKSHYPSYPIKWKLSNENSLKCRMMKLLFFSGRFFSRIVSYFFQVYLNAILTFPYVHWRSHRSL